MKKIKDVHILNHTHWDREWYETFEEFRYKLRNGLRYVQQLLDEGKIENFFIDGQTIVLDDYEEIVSKEEYEKLITHIKEGKIEVGPWYLLADEFLVSGESILKNLELGINKAKEYDSSYNIGYLPDTFGHISQMPQIFQGYGINTAIVWRGAVSSTFENRWKGADGSEVFTFVLPLFEGYYQTFLKHQDYKEKMEDYINRNEPYVTQSQLLMMNGADHTFTCEDLNEKIETLNTVHEDMYFQQSLMSQYIKAIKEKDGAGQIVGEQRDESKIFILPGVYSTRMYLKNQNQQCEDSAIHQMEALNAWSNGNTNSDHFIAYVWKLILQNQPHDSICGCSIDEVHDEMETRSQKVISAIRQFTKDTLNELYPFEYIDGPIHNHQLYVVNNTPLKDIYKVSTSIYVPVELDKGAIALTYKGEQIPFDVIQREQREEFLRHIKAEPHYGEYVVYDIQMMLPFDGVETKAITISIVEQQQFIAQQMEKETIENEYYCIRWNNESLTITDIQEKKVYENQHAFFASLDAGDTYNYSPPVEDVWRKGKIISVDPVICGETFQSVAIYYELEMPASLNKQRTGGCEEVVINEMKTTVTLYKGKRFVHFKTSMTNRGKDQKVRVGFYCERADESYSDTAFDLVKRETLRHKQLDMPKNKEAKMNQYPTLSTVIANNHQVLHRGLQEYEIEEINEQDYVCLTMLRSVGWLSRRDLRTRGNGAGPGFETPGAQCIGTYEFEYGLVLGEQYASSNHKFFFRSDVLTQQSYVEKEERKLFSQSSSTIAFSSFIQKEEDAFQIRMYNPKEQVERTMLTFGFTPKCIEEVDFEGNVLHKYETNKEIEIEFQPKQIKTIRVKLV